MRQTQHSLKELNRRALVELGLDYDALPPMMRVGDIVQRPKRAHAPPGLLPIATRTWWEWVAKGLVPEPTKFDNGVSAWPRAVVVKIALDGLPVRPRNRFTGKVKSTAITG